MKSTYRSRPGLGSAVPSADGRAGADVGVVFWSVVSVLVIGNVVTNRLAPNWAYVPVNVVVTVVIVVLARRAVGTVEIGATNWANGLRWGGTLLVVTAIGMGLAAVTPGLSDLFDDDRVNPGVAAVAYHAAFRIPFGTVLLEETAFRGVLPALAARRLGVVRGYVVASVMFGLWHVLPSIGLGDVNPVFRRWFGEGWPATTATVTLAVIGTFIAGLWLSWLRHRSGSLLTTALAHVATNSVGYTIAWLATR